MVKSHTDSPTVTPSSFFIEGQARRIAGTVDPAIRLQCIAAIFTQDIREIQRSIAYANENGYQGTTGYGLRIVAQMLSHLYIPKDPHHE